MKCYACTQENRNEAQMCAHCGTRIKWREWVIEKQLGQGGMGTAYLVRNSTMQAVLKLPHADVTLDEHLRECRNLYIAAELGVTPRPIETSPDAVIMEYLAPDGVMTAHERIRTLFRALNTLHNRGLIAVDVKPENMIPTRDGIKLIDLGSMVDSFRDKAPEILATPGYAAPELYRGIVTPLVDAYSAAWCALEMLGHGSPNPAKVGPPDSLRLPQELAFIADMLRSEPEKRVSVGLGYHAMIPEYITLSSRSRIGSDLVTTSSWSTMMKASTGTLHYVTGVDKAQIDEFCQKTGTRLPTLDELIELATGTELQTADRGEGPLLVSNLGARHCRRYLWQPTSDGYIFGGTTHAEIDSAPWDGTGNRMIGLRVVQM